MHGRLHRFQGIAIALTMVSTLPLFAQGMGAIQIDPTRIRQQILGRVQDQVGFTDEEWKVIEPKLWKVVSLQAQTGSGTLGTMASRLRRGMGRGGGGGGFDVDTLMSQLFNNGQPMVVLQKQQALQDAVDDPNVTDPQLAVRLREYRDVLQKTKLELGTAQKDLTDVLTVRQEAELMDMGFLD